MVVSLNFMIAYFIGGLTLFPITIILLCIVYFIYSRVISPIHSILSSYNKIRNGHYKTTLDSSALLKGEIQNEDSTTGGSTTNNPLYRVGWLKVSRDEEQSLPDASIGDMITSYISGKASKREKANVYFAVLKYSTLYLYDSEKQLDCKEVIKLNGNIVSTHPPGLQDFELFSKPHLIKLKGQVATFYINCNRCIDKEDWFFAFIRASKLPLANQAQQIQQHDKTHFDQSAMNHLITMVHSDEHHFQTQWLNAILGRIFFGVYRTKDVKDALYKKVMSKLDKINAKRPPFLGEITVRSVDPGHSLPRFTQPKLLGLSPTGELSAEAHMQYDGGFRIEIETVLSWKYSDLLRPLTMNIVLGITLKEIQGKLLIKIKEPPTNRFWYGFYECPKMEWKVEPVVWEKRIGYSVVVKAIETKIQEFIMETMVLPNFDDITFFPTNGVGGIFEISPDEDTITTTTTTTTTDTAAADTTTSAAIPIKETKKSKEAHQERHRDDKALLTTAKSLPELFSAVPDRQPQQQQQSKLRTQLDDTKSEPAIPFSNNNIYQRNTSAPTLSTSPLTTNSIITKNSNSSCSPQQQQQSKLRTQLDDTKSEPAIPFSNNNIYQRNTSAPTLSTSPLTTNSIITKNSNSSCSPRLVPTDEIIAGQIAISNPNNNHDTSSFLSTSPDSLSSSPSSSTIDDSLRTLTHVLTDDTNIIVSPSTSTSLACDSVQHNTIQITYSQDYTTSSTDAVISSSETVRLRKSSSLALLRPKTGASTAINVSPAMAHKVQQDKKDIDSISVPVASI